MTVRIVTDSTADIMPEEARAIGLTVVPLTVFFGDEAYLDNIDLDNASFYEKLKTSSELPRTSQPAPALFQETFTRLIEEGATGILSVHLSSKLSGTYQSACTARDTLPDEIRNKIPIEVIDSRSITLGMALALRKAIEEAQQGLPLAEIKEHLVDQLARTRILVTLDTLEYVKRGGRIGGAKAMLGNMLSVKPIIALKDGEVIPVEQPRTRNKAYLRMAQIARDAGPVETVAIGETDTEAGDQLEAVVRSVFPEFTTILRSKLGGVLGTHTGPGTVGLVTVGAK